MQFGYSALLATVTAAVTVTAQVSSGYSVYVKALCKPDITSPFTSVSFYNGTLYTGDAKLDSFSEPFIFSKGTDGPSSISFTSYHSSPTGWSNMYIFPKEAQAPGFTPPHGSFIPPGADAYNFTIATVGTEKQLRYKNTTNWYACPSDIKPRYYEIIYAGEGKKADKDCTNVALVISPYGSCPK